jgi:hypothetical protein
MTALLLANCGGDSQSGRPEIQDAILGAEDVTANWRVFPFWELDGPNSIGHGSTMGFECGYGTTAIRSAAVYMQEPSTGPIVLNRVFESTTDDQSELESLRQRLPSCFAESTAGELQPIESFPLFADSTFVAGLSGENDLLIELAVLGADDRLSLVILLHDSPEPSADPPFEYYVERAASRLEPDRERVRDGQQFAETVRTQ